MATAVNPIVVGPLNGMPELVRVQVDASQTYPKGACIVLTGGQLAVAADGEIPWGQAATDAGTAIAEDSYVWAYRWTEGLYLEMYVSSGASESTIATANKGKAYDLQRVGTGTSSIHYLDKAATTDKVFKVVDLSAEYEPIKCAASDSPGKCIAEVLVVQTA